MDQIRAEILDAAELISLILVFSTVLFDIRYRHVVDTIRAEAPPGEHARRRHRSELMGTLLVKVLPLVLFNCLAAFLFLPLVLRIIALTRLSLWGFDFVTSAFILVFSAVSSFAAWSLYLAFGVCIAITRSR